MTGTGYCVLALGFLFAFIFDDTDIGFIGLFIGVLLIIPYSWKLFRNNSGVESSSIFWFIRFLALPLLLIVCFIYFLKRIA
ncbi:MAG: hypothetical protein FWH35_06865 [Treponema sp.]|nr:hypothetical protein [Treponema sp.]